LARAFRSTQSQTAASQIDGTSQPGRVAAACEAQREDEAKHVSLSPCEKALKGEFGAVDAAGPWSDEKAFRQFNPA
jgi:hypothetical protein